MFTGFPEETLRFFLDLRFHNQISYFEQRREDYVQDVQTPFYDLIGDLAPRMQRIDPQMEIRPYKCLARIRRDTRFTKDKSPYRDHLWVLFRRAAEPREQSLNYWFEFGPQQFGWGLTFWGENRPVMDRFRRELAARPQKFLDTLEGCDLPGHHLALGGSYFKRLTIPEGLPPEAERWYRARELFITRVDPDPQWAFNAKLVDRIWNDYRALAPLYKLLRGMVDDEKAEEAL